MSEASGSTLNSLDRSSLTELFEACDMTSKGHLDSDDLARLCRELEVGSSDPQEAEELFKRLDSDGDGRIDVDDLLSAYERVGLEVNIASPDDQHGESRSAWTSFLSGIDGGSVLQWYECLSCNFVLIVISSFENLYILCCCYTAVATVCLYSGVI